MTTLVLGLGLWWLTHLFPIYAPGGRARAVARLGEKPWKALFALVSILAIWLMVRGFRAAPFIEIWSPPSWTVHINNLLMLLAVFLLGAGHMKSPVARRVRHPMLASVVVWAVAHLLVNGDLAAFVLFGGMGLWAIVAIIGSNARDGEWTPPAVEGSGRLKFHVLATLVVFVAIVVIHGPILGVRPLPG